MLPEVALQVESTPMFVLAPAAVNVTVSGVALYVFERATGLPHRVMAQSCVVQSVPKSVRHFLTKIGNYTRPHYSASCYIFYSIALAIKQYLLILCNVHPYVTENPAYRKK